MATDAPSSDYLKDCIDKQDISALKAYFTKFPDELHNNKAIENCFFPLFYAVMNNKPKVVSAIIELRSGSDTAYLNQQNINGDTAAHWASHTNNSSILQMLIEAKADVISIRNKAGNTCFHAAAKSNAFDCLKLLYNTKQIDINVSGNKGFTPLMFCLPKKDVAVIHQLLEWGADIETIQNEAGQTALTYSVSLDKFYGRYAEILNQWKLRNKPLNREELRALFYTAEKNLDIIKKHYQDHPDQINSNTFIEEYPFLQAVLIGSPVLVDCFINELKCDINIMNQWTGSAAAVACSTGNTVILEKLITAGVDITKSNPISSNPISLAISPHGHRSLAGSPFLVSILKNNPACMKLLYDTGKININSTEEDVEGNSYLMIAVGEWGYKEVFAHDRGYMTEKFRTTSLDAVKQLLEWNADRNIKNKKGQTAMDLAKVLELKELVDLLARNNS